MTQEQFSQLGKTLWAIADDLRGAMNADDFRNYDASVYPIDISKQFP